MDTTDIVAVDATSPEGVKIDLQVQAESANLSQRASPTDEAVTQDHSLNGHVDKVDNADNNVEQHPEMDTSDGVAQSPEPYHLSQSTDTQQSEESESTGGEQEGHIENLAQLLAENLCREHTTATSDSIFNFEEFESEQDYHLHQERLQQHLYQQHVLHQQEMQRQQDRLRRHHLSIITPDSSRYSALPSPGSKFFKQTPVRTPQSPSGNRSQSPTWYRAEDNATYINRSGSPCSRKDRLYEAMPYQYFEKESLQSKYTPQYPHQPVLISKPLYQPVDADREGFFQRLYETHFDQSSQLDSARRQTAQQIVQVGNTVHPRVLSEAERNQVTDRLLHHKAYLNRKFEAQRVGVSHALKEQQNGRFVDKKSHKLVAQTQRNALSEIFDVLLVTAQMQRERPSAPKNADFLDKYSDPVETATSPDVQDPNNPTNDDSNNKQDKPSDLLDTSLAQARFLQPKQLADAIGVILTALNPRLVSRKQFVEFTLLCMHKKYQIELPNKKKQSVAENDIPATKSANGVEGTASNLASTPASDFASASATSTHVSTDAGAPPSPIKSTIAVETQADLLPTEPSMEAGPESTEQVSSELQLYRASSFGSTRSRANSPAPTPRANRASTLRTALVSPSAQHTNKIFSPAHSGSRQNMHEESHAKLEEPGEQRMEQRVDTDATETVPAASIPVVIPPIGYLLVAASTGGSGSASQRERQEGTQAQREYRQHFTGQPHLVAQKTTERLVQQRYAERVNGNQKVEDSLLAYAEQKRNNILQISMELDRATRRDCTFQPNINTPYMMRFKATGREIPEHRNVRTMIRRSASRSKSRSRAASAAQAQAEGDNPPGDAHTDTSASLDGHEEQESGRGRFRNGSSGSGKRTVDTRPQVLGENGYEAAPPVILDQKEYLGFKSRSNSSKNLRRTGSNPGMKAPGDEIALGSVSLDFMLDNAEYQNNYLSSPSGARTTALSAQFRGQNGFLSNSVPSRKHGRGAGAATAGRFSYGATVQQANYQTHQQSPRLPHTTSAYSLHQNNCSNAQLPSANPDARFFSYVHEGSDRGKHNLQAPSPRSLTTNNSLLHSQSTPSMRTPRTTQPAEYTLTEEALHRKMYKDLYYNF